MFQDLNRFLSSDKNSVNCVLTWVQVKRLLSLKILRLPLSFVQNLVGVLHLFTEEQEHTYVPKFPEFVLKMRRKKLKNQVMRFGHRCFKVFIKWHCSASMIMLPSTSYWLLSVV
jgi:hypothetical protein